MGRETVKFWVTDGNVTVSAVGFGMAKTIPELRPGMRINLAYHMGVDDWNKAPVPQLMLKDVQTNETLMMTRRAVCA
jgi:hypothetical protein